MSRRAPAWLSLTLVVVLLLQVALPAFTPPVAVAAAAAPPSATVTPEPASRVLLAPTVVNVPTAPLVPTVAFSQAAALTTIPPVTTIATPAAPLDLNLHLSLDVDPPWAAPGEAVTFTVVAMNPTEGVLPALVITDTLPDGLLYIAQSGQGFAYDADAQLLTWLAGDLAAGAAITGSFQARVQDLASGVMLTNTVSATSPASTAAVTATVMLEVVVPRSNEAWVTPETGGLLRSADDRLLLRAPPGAVEGRTLIRYTPRPDLEELPSYILAPFALEAQDENGQFVREFAAPLTLRLALTPTSNSSTILGEPGLFTLDEASGHWLALPSDANSGTNCLNATLTHFSIYSEGDITYIVERMASLRGAQTNLFTRSIGYGYGFELPPGRGGLTPVLGLSYSSSNHTPNSGHFSLAGYGWQLTGADAIYIAPGDANVPKPTLSLQGTTYSLRRTGYDGQTSAWFAKENPFLKVETANESHGTAGTWYIWTPDGTRYTFDATTAASEYYWKLCGTTDEDRRYVRVPLVSITDSQGNTVSYTWEAEEDSSGPEACPNHVRGTRLKNLSYNGGAVQVVFDYTDRLDRPDGYNSAAWRFYTTRKLSTVTIRVQDGGAGSWRTVRRYALEYNSQEETPAVSQKVLNLDWLEEQAADGAAWPRTTFGYTHLAFSEQNDFGALTWVRNGFGGEVSFATANRMSGQPLIVTTRTEKDLITATAPVTWTYTSNSWLEGGTSNGETLASGYGEVDITDPGGGVTKRFFHVTDAVTGGQIDARAGRERLTEVWSGGAKLHWTVTTWISDTTSLPVAGVHPLSNEALKPRFVYTGSTETYETGGQRVLRIENYYQTGRQGASGEQFGNLTEQRVIAGTATGWWTSEPLRTRYTWYYPNTAAWIINRPAQVQLYRACIGCPNAAHETTSLYYYDNATGETTPPTAGRLTQQRAGVGTEQITTATYEYWPNGNVKRVTDGRGHATRTLYDSAFQVYPVCVVNALGHVTLTRYYGVPGLAAGDVGTGVDQCPQQPGAGDAAWDGAGVPVSGRFFGQTQTVTDPNGAATTYGYDVLGRLTSESRVPDTAATRVYEYRPFSQVDTNQPFWVRTRQKDSAAPAGSSNVDYANTYAYYDGFGQVLQIKVEADSGRNVETSTSYTWFGAVERQGAPVFSAEGDGSSATLAWNQTAWNAVRTGAATHTLTAYDARQRVTQVTPPDNAATRQYYAAGVDAVEGVRLKQATLDANNHQTVTEMDALGRLRASQQYTGEYAVAPDWQATPYAAASYTYNARDLLTEVQDRDAVTTELIYDSLGRKTDLSDPDMGAWSYGYDAAGNLTRQTDARDQTTCFYYDGLNRLKGKTHRGDVNCPTADPGSYAVSYGYDSTAGGNPGLGRRTSMTTSGTEANSASWIYDARGRVTSETRTIGGVAYSTGYSYDSADRMRTTTYPDNEAVATSYNAQGLAAGLAGSATYVSSATYDAAGRSDVRTLGGGLATDYDYFPWTQSGGRLQWLKTGPSGSLQKLEYAYDAAGNVDWVKDWQAGAPQLQDFAYDALNRLTAAAATGGSAGLYSESYAYDPNGNLTSKAGAAYTYADATHAHAVTHVGGAPRACYDANGNQTMRLVGDKLHVLEYDAENRLVTVSERANFGANIGRSGTSAALSWAAVPGATAYEVWRDTTPYFIPGVSGSVKVTTTASTSTSDAGRIGNPATNYYYLILATANNCPLGVSQRIGEFDFALAPGTLAGVAAVPATDATARAAPAASLPEGTLADTQIASFTYDADGRRVSATVAGVTTVYPFDHYEVAGTVVRKYYSVGGTRVAMRTDGALSYLLTDHLGSTSVSTDADGTPAGELRYLPYGGTRHESGVTPTSFRFTGQRAEATLGLYSFNARYYDPALGRFIQADTLVPNPGDPQSLNRYAYALNNPLKYTDPTGHCVFAPPFDTLVCVGFLAVTLLASGSGPPPPNYPKNYYSAISCTDALPGCFGDVVRLKDFSNNGPDNPIPLKEFEDFAAKVAEDLYSHDVDWPGLAGGRGAYDTPFYNGGQSERRTGDSDAQKGVFPANQSVCIAGIGCAGRSEINYIAQGMWGARTGESKPISEAIVWTWKLWEYQEKPSDETLFWLQYGYDYYLRWLEQQQANAPTP